MREQTLGQDQTVAGIGVVRAHLHARELADGIIRHSPLAVGAVITAVTRGLNMGIAEGLQVVLGAEPALSALAGSSVIAVSYGPEEHPIGALAVIGPMRMNYGKVMSVVDVTAEGAAFNDPSQENMTAAMGGMIGNMALGFDMAKRMELSIPVHDRVCDLLLALVRAPA